MSGAGPASDGAAAACDTVASDGAAYDAVVLAGGAGRRLGGVAKPEVRVGGRALLDRALDAVAGARRRVVVGPEALARPGVTTTLEDPPLGGPVAGIDAGLAALGAEAADVVVVLACDVPRAGEVVPALVARLAGAPEADAAVALDADGRRQWLLGAYRRAALAGALDALRPGGVRDRSVRSLVAPLSAVAVPAGGAAADADTWQDVAAFDGASEGSGR